MRLTFRSGDLTYVYDGTSLVRALLSGGDGREVDTSGEANLVSSKCEDGFHRPIIDLDVPHRLVPSSTEGHSHLYIDVPMRFWRYALLLAALRLAGVIEKGYFAWSIRRRASFARLPGVYKEGDPF